MSMFGRHRQRGVDGRRKRMDQVRPFGIVQPECAATAPAKMALRCTRMSVLLARVLYLCVVDADVVAPRHFQRLGIGAQVDCVAAAALGLAAYRTITTLIGIRRSAVHAEPYRRAMTGSF